MGDHVNTKKDTAKRHKRGFAESRYIVNERARRVTFKKYVEQLEQDLLESDDGDDDEPYQMFEDHELS